MTARSEIDSAVVVLSKRRRAAHDLWRQGYLVESTMILESGLASVERALALSGEGSGLGDDLAALRREYALLSEPPTSKDSAPQHARWLERARTLALRAEKVLTADARRRRRRIVIAGSLAAALLAALASFALYDARVRVSSSARFDDGHPARHVVDLSDVTEWLLPDGKNGWVELSFKRRRHLTELSITNAHNQDYLDRAARRIKVICFDGDRIVYESELEFEKIEEKPSPKRIALGGLKVSKVRVEVLSFWKTGGGLAEIRFR